MHCGTWQLCLVNVRDEFVHLRERSLRLVNGAPLGEHHLLLHRRRVVQALEGVEAELKRDGRIVYAQAIDVG